MPICTWNFYHWHFKIHRLYKKIFLNLGGCSPFVYFGTILFSENENKANKHNPAPHRVLVLVWEHNAAMFGSRTAESNVCSENLPLWKLLKLPDIPVLWGVCPPAALLGFLQSPCKVVSTPTSKWFQRCWKCFYLPGGSRYQDAGSASVPFSGCSEHSSQQLPPPRPPRLRASLGRPVPFLPCLLLLPQLLSHLEKWVWLLWVVQLGGHMYNSPSELVHQGEFLGEQVRDWSCFYYLPIWK